MEAKDLMIGDWVNIAVKEYNNPTRIREIGSFWIKVIKDEMEYGNILVTPIPLTTEILEKNGFACYEDDEDSFYDTNCVFIKQDLDGYGVCLDKICTISGILHYVHQLQHALRLCGIDKEIELL